MAKNRRKAQNKRTKFNRSQVIQIDVLPDDVLLQIFDFYIHLEPVFRTKSRWPTLVRVCGRWRSLVFQSPRRLNLRLYCTPQKLVKDKLGIWPTLPLIVRGKMASSSGIDNVIAALELSNRVSQVDFWSIAVRQFEKLLAAMQVPFPELTRIRLTSHDETLPVIPDSFLGGSAPSLASLDLDGISPFPGLPNLLLSATHLVSLSLTNISHSGYISPEAIVTPLSSLPSLVSLYLGFRSPQSCPDWRSRSLRPQKRSTLPLKKLHFKGVAEYLEELLARIDTPRLEIIEITFFNQIDFDCPQLARLFNRTPILRSIDEACVEFSEHTAWVRFRSRKSSRDLLDNPTIGVPCRESDWQLSCMEQICNSGLPSPSKIKYLYIERKSWRKPTWEIDTTENALWLQLFLPFTAVKKLYLHTEFVPGIAAALQELVGGRNTEVLPSLRKIFVRESEPLENHMCTAILRRPELDWSVLVSPESVLQGDINARSLKKDIRQFLATRRLSGCPITISKWDRSYR